MDSDGVPVDLDYTKVEAISARRTNAFVNNYLTTCTHFLNRYIATCEEQLAEIESSEMQLTALVNALEHKLNSVASLAASNESSKPPPSVTTTVSEVPNQIPEPSTVVQETPAATSTPETPSNMIAVSKHPRYKKFFDLKKYGVSDPQIQLNMRNNGIDPSMVDLDKPDLLVPYEDVTQDQDSDSSSSTSSSFDEAMFRQVSQSIEYSNRMSNEEEMKRFVEELNSVRQIVLEHLDKKWRQVDEEYSMKDRLDNARVFATGHRFLTIVLMTTFVTCALPLGCFLASLAGLTFLVIVGVVILEGILFTMSSSILGVLLLFGAILSFGFTTCMIIGYVSMEYSGPFNRNICKYLSSNE